MGEDIGGIAVHVAARIAALAEVGEVLTSHSEGFGSGFRLALRRSRCPTAQGPRRSLSAAGGRGRVASYSAATTVTMEVLYQPDPPFASGRALIINTAQTDLPGRQSPHVRIGSFSTICAAAKAGLSQPPRRRARPFAIALITLLAAALLQRLHHWA